MYYRWEVVKVSTDRENLEISMGPILVASHDSK